MYIAITGLKLRKPWLLLHFYWYAVPSFMQAQNSPGNISVEAKNINGIKHTLSVWESKSAMQKFVYSGKHLKAIQAFGKIATGKTLNYESDTVPSWDEVHAIWQEQGREYTKTPPQKH